MLELVVHVPREIQDESAFLWQYEGLGFRVSVKTSMGDFVGFSGFGSLFSTRRIDFRYVLCHPWIICRSQSRRGVQPNPKS